VFGRFPLPWSIEDNSRLSVSIQALAASPTGQPNNRGEQQGDNQDNRLPFGTVERVAPYNPCQKQPGYNGGHPIKSFSKPGYHFTP
jgi:hypothetical protein